MSIEEMNSVRKKFKSELIKKILIRFDFSGITSVDQWIENNSQFLKNHFELYSKGSYNNATLNLTKPNDIAKTLSVPVSDIQREIMHTFTNWKLDGEDEVELRLTPYFCTLTIDCNNYGSIEGYLQFLKEMIESLYSVYAFMRIERIGIRKIGGKIFNEKEEIESIYPRVKSIIPSIKDCDVITFYNESSESFILKNKTLKGNLSYKFRVVEDKGNKYYQVVQDIDCYIDQYIIDTTNFNVRENLSSILDNINLHLFVIFYNSLNQEYAKDHINNG